MENHDIIDCSKDHEKYYYLSSDDIEALSIYHGNFNQYIIYSLASELYELQSRHKIKYKFLKTIYNGFIKYFHIYIDCDNELSYPESKIFKTVLELFNEKISNNYITKESVYNFIDTSKLHGINWKSIKIILQNDWILSLLHELLVELEEKSYIYQMEADEAIDKIYELVEILKWKETKFRKELKEDKLKLNPAFVNRFVLKENNYFDKFYLPWMKPYLKEAEKHYKDFLEYMDEQQNELEEEENDYSVDWWDGQPDFDLDEISDPDLRDSLRDLYD